jgi:hypothetical protein
MDRETLREVGSIIDLARFGTEGNNGAGSWELINQLYGLYDGYLYDELIINSQDLPKDLFRRIAKVWSVVVKYPVLHRYNEPAVVIDEEVETIEYSPNMGVAEGKSYLASLEY